MRDSEKNEARWKGGEADECATDIPRVLPRTPRGLRLVGDLRAALLREVGGVPPPSITR